MTMTFEHAMAYAHLFGVSARDLHHLGNASLRFSDIPDALITKYYSCGKIIAARYGDMLLIRQFQLGRYMDRATVIFQGDYPDIFEVLDAFPELEPDTDISEWSNAFTHVYEKATFDINDFDQELHPATITQEGKICAAIAGKILGLEATTAGLLAHLESLTQALKAITDYSSSAYALDRVFYPPLQEGVGTNHNASPRGTQRAPIPSKAAPLVDNARK